MDSFLVNTCYVCSNFIDEQESHSVIIADNSNNTPLNKLLTDILDESIDKNQSKSTTLCGKCYETCTEYDVIEKRLAEIKNEFKLQFKDSISKNVCQTAVASVASTSTNNVQKIEKSPQKKVVVSSSKLMPVPATYQFINNIKVQSTSPTSSIMELSSPVKLNLNTQKCSPSILSKTKKISPTFSNKLRRIAPKINITLPSYTLSTPALPTTSTPVVLNTEPVLPENQSLDNYLVLPSDDVEEKLDQHVMQVVDDSEQVQTSEDYSIIECNKSDEQNETQEEDDSENNELINVCLDNNDDINEDDSEYIKLEILEHDNDDVLETIIMEEDESGSLLRVISGQKVIYVNDEISVIIPETESDKDDSVTYIKEDKDIIELEYNADDLDDNDSQIELRAAGDEETAKAIIQAAAERGGAFIKKQSGEMFRVDVSVAALDRIKKDVPDTGTPCSDVPNTAAPCSDVAQGDGGQYMVQKVGKKFKCLLCENIKKKKAGTKIFMGDAFTIVDHVKEVHNARVYVCPTCSLIMRKCSDFSKHVLTHKIKLPNHNIAPDMYKVYQCDLCSKKLMSRNLLIEHLNMHNKKRPHVCDKCDKTFASKYTCKAHMKTHLNRPRPFQCLTCPKSFFTQQNLSQHAKTHSSVKDFLCKVCSKTFVSQHNLEMHGLVHTRVKAYKCDFCEKPFARRAELRDHRRTHTGEKPFPCDMCDMRFSQRSNLQSHRRATHFDDRRYSCQTCEKKFKRRRLLDYHIQAAHTGERPFQCDKCKSSFVYPEHFRKHLRIHTGERPYACGICTKTFNTLDTRNKHRFTHTQSKPYQCGVCNVGFMRKPQLLAHADHYGHNTKPMIINPTPRVSDNAESILPLSPESILPLSPDSIEKNRVFVKPDLFKPLEEQEESEKEGEDSESIVIKDGLLLQNEYDPMYTIEFDTSSSTTRELFGSDSISDEVIHSNKINILDASIISNKSIQVVSDEEIMVQDEATGAIMKLVQMQLENGQTGWVALGT